MPTEITFDEACGVLETALKGQARTEILGYLCKLKAFNDALLKLRAGMRSHTFKIDSGQLNLGRLVKTLDLSTKRDGFTVLIDWDGKKDTWNEDTIPVDVLNYFMRGVESQTMGSRERLSLSILLDYYFLYVLALLAMRVGDQGSVPENVDRVTRLIADLQGPAGSGQRHVDDTGTLVLIATAHFEPDAAAYERLIARIRAGWNEDQQRRFALAHAAILGSHLRHGFRDVYLRDLGLMRADNGPDYPCLCFALLSLMRTYSRMHTSDIQGDERKRVAEALLNGLTADPRAFLGKLPESLANYAADQTEFSSLFLKYHKDLLEEFEPYRPSYEQYSALAFNFNFPHNLLKGMVIDALFAGQPSTVSLNDLLTGVGGDSAGRESLARSLTGYSRRVPDNIGNRPVPVIYYDSHLGLQNFVKTLSTIRELVMGLWTSEIG